MGITHNRYDKALRLIPDTLEWCQHQDVTELREFLLTDNGLPIIFLGSGGSLSAAYLAMELSVGHGIAAAAMTPYQYIFSAWSKLPAKVFAFSAGGRNIDVINAFKTANQNNSQIFEAIIMSKSTTLGNMMNENGIKPFSYQLKNDDGFLATNSLVGFYSLLFKVYQNVHTSIDNWSFIEDVETSLKSFISGTYNLSTNDWGEHDAALYEARETDRFYVLYSPDTQAIAIDLESRFSEGSIGCLQISDYRNFAHGRFNWFNQRKGQTAIIALITPESKDVAETILSELPDYICVFKLTTDYSGAKGIMELLLKGMYLSKYLGLRWGLDIGAPTVATFGKIIHQKDFMPSEAATDADLTVPDVQQTPSIDDSILCLPIANIARVKDNIIRGETLWASHNRRYLRNVKAAGVDTIVDFRTADHTDRFSIICAANGLDYYHFPIDKANVNDHDLIKSLPLLFYMLDTKKCYISCQQGLHSTNIALAIYYMFHQPTTIPILPGHFKNGVFRCDDIMRRLNSIYKSLSIEDKETLKISDLNDSEFRRRRKSLLGKNREINSL